MTVGVDESDELELVPVTPLGCMVGVIEAAATSDEDDAMTGSDRRDPDGSLESATLLVETTKSSDMAVLEEARASEVNMDDDVASGSSGVSVIVVVAVKRFVSVCLTRKIFR